MFKWDAKTLLFFLISALCIVHHIESLTLSSDSSIRHNPISVVNAVDGVKTLFATSIWDWEVKQSEIETSENELDLSDFFYSCRMDHGFIYTPYLENGTLNLTWFKTCEKNIFRMLTVFVTPAVAWTRGKICWSSLTLHIILQKRDFRFGPSASHAIHLKKAAVGISKSITSWGCLNQANTIVAN